MTGEKNIYGAAPAATPLIKLRGNSGKRSIAGRLILSAFFVTAGVLHFVFPANYIRIVPPLLPSPALIVLLSGIAEIAGGLGLLWRVTQRAAAWGLILLLLAVFPANIYTAIAHLPFPGFFGKSWAQWLRLPLQFPLIYWTWLYTRPYATVGNRVPRASPTATPSPVPAAAMAAHLDSSK